MKRMYMLSLILFVLAMGLGNATFSIVSNTITPAQVGPGEFGTIDLIISNAGTSSVTGMAVEIRTTDQITIQKNLNIGDLSPGAQISISIPFKVSETAKTGIYAMDLDFFGVGDTYSSSDVANRGVIYKKVFSTLRIVSPPVIQLSLDKNEINDLSELKVTLTNSKGKAKKVYVKILNEQFGFLNKDLIYIDSLENVQEIDTIIDARNANDGAQKISFQINYEDELGNNYMDTRNISVTVRKESGDFVFIQDTSITTGKQQDLVLKIRNDGNAIQNLRMSLDDSEVQLYGISTINVGDIAKGEMKTVTIPVIATAKPGSKQVKVNLKWVEQNKDKESSKLVSIKVSSDSEIGVYLEARPAPVTIGSEHTISITISNMGSYPIEATTVNLESEAFSLLTIEKEQYVGGLNNDDFSSVQYKVRVIATEQKEYPVNITVKFKDSSGEWKTEKITKIIYPTYPTATQSSGIECIVIIALVVIGGIVWWYRNKCNVKAKRVQ